jgi:hypothetical protein
MTSIFYENEFSTCINNMNKFRKMYDKAIQFTGSYDTNQGEDVSTLAKGVYMYSFVANGIKTQTGKVIIE